jgi:hypothetical protein
MGDGGSSTTARRGPGSNVFVSFGPWIAVWVLTSNHSFVPGLLIATGLSVALIVWSYASGDHPKLLDWGTLGSFVLLTIVALVGDEAWLGYWLSPLLNVALLAVMVGSLAVGHPFTIDYAKEEAPPEVWDSPEFAHVNRVITLVWIAAVAAMAVGSIVSALLRSGAVATADSHTIEGYANWGVTVVALVGASKFSAWYPDAYQARMERPAASAVSR